MTKPIIVGYDPRRADHAPLEFGVAAAELSGAQLLVLSAQAPMHVTPSAPVGMIAYSLGGSTRICCPTAPKRSRRSSRS
jgi:hypothetical protein